MKTARNILSAAIMLMLAVAAQAQPDHRLPIERKAEA